MAVHSLYHRFLQEKSQSITSDQLHESTREDLLRSFFGLCKTNGGKFKSEKQASFLLSQAENGVFVVKQTINFGTSRHSQREVEWEVTLDNVGVVTIYKRTNSKGNELYFAREGQEGAEDSIAAKQISAREKNKGATLDQLRATNAQWAEERDKLQAENEKMNGVIDDPQYASIRDVLLGRLKDNEASIQEYNKRIEYNESLLK